MSCVLALVMLTGIAGCRRKPKVENNPPTATPAPAPDAKSASTPTASPAPEPINVPTGGGSSLAPSEKDDAAKSAVKTQNRFSRNSEWLSKLGSNNPQTRAQVAAEIQAARLSPAEMQELRKQAQMYGIKF